MERRIHFAALDLVAWTYHGCEPIRMIQEPVTSKRYKLACALIKYSDQPAHPRSLIRVFDKPSMDSQVSNVSSGGKLRLWLDCANAQTLLNLRYTHMPACAICWAQVPLGSLTSEVQPIFCSSRIANFDSSTCWYFINLRICIKGTW